MRRLNTEQFIARARQVHGDRYGYGLTEYKDSSTPVLIICNRHGQFSQSPENHLAGKGCGRCANNQRLPAQEIIRRFHAIHGDGYVYDAASLTDTKGRIKATCILHGPFLVSLCKHLAGAGCPRCTGNYQHAARNHFVRRAREIHGSKYKYGTYKAAAKKMRIVCPTHGNFSQTPASHLRSHGCPGCANDRKKLLAKGGYSEEFFALHPDMIQHPATMYLIEFWRMGESFLKIGITRTSTKSRFKSGYRKYSWWLLASRSLPLYEAFLLEQKLLSRFRAFQVFPRQNGFVGKTECLSPACVCELLSWLEAAEHKVAKDNADVHLNPATSPNPVLSK
jgi:hypothetical protein